MGDIQDLQVSPAQYHSHLTLNRDDIFDPNSYLSKSALWKLRDDSLWKFRYHPDQYTNNAMRWGALIDVLLTTPSEFKDLYEVKNYSSFRSKAATNWREEVEAQGKTAVLLEQFKLAKKAVEVFPQHKEAKRIIETSAPQCILLGKYEDPYHKRVVNLKGLCDFTPTNRPYLVDLKTTAEFSRAGIQRTIYKFGYHVQAALYLHLWNLMHPDDQRKRFRFIFQQSSPPFEVAVTELALDDINAGLDMVRYLLRKLIRAYVKNEFPMLMGSAAEMVSMSEWSRIAEEMIIEEMDKIEAPRK